MTQEIITPNNAVLVRAELDTQIATANAYPRDERESIEKAIGLATIDEETAQGCFYSLPRKDKEGNKIAIEGDSIRLAEIIRCCWRHMHTQTRVIEVADKHITTEAVCWDLQNNNKHIATDRISIWFGEKNGKGGYRANNDMQIMLAKASQAKALRNAIFQVVPKALVKVVSVATKKFAIGDSKTLNSKVIQLVDKLVKMGIDKELMLEYYECKSLNDITPEIYSSLIGVGTAIKEGFIKVEQVFEVEKDDDTSLSAAERINILIADKKSEIDRVTGELIEHRKE